MNLLLILFVGWSHPAVRPPAMWGGEAHKLVCEIAYRHLTPEARGMVQQLTRRETGSFADTCVWADEVRPERPQTSAYHFVNIPAGVTGFDMRRDCGDPATRCVVWAIKHYAILLANRNTPEAQRIEALKFLSHFVGDLHQPLHAGRPGDLGGNRVYVSFFGDAGSDRSRNQLHRVWDSSIAIRAGIGFPASTNTLMTTMTPIDVSMWANSDVIGWANESYRIAEEFVYSVPSGSEIGDAYFQRAVPIVKRRMQQAGIRLAHLSNEAARGRTNFTF